MVSSFCAILPMFPYFSIVPWGGPVCDEVSTYFLCFFFAPTLSSHVDPHETLDLVRFSDLSPPCSPTEFMIHIYFVNWHWPFPYAPAVSLVDFTSPASAAHVFLVPPTRFEQTFTIEAFYYVSFDFSVLFPTTPPPTFVSPHKCFPPFSSRLSLQLPFFSCSFGSRSMIPSLPPFEISLSQYSYYSAFLAASSHFVTSFFSAISFPTFAIFCISYLTRAHFS